MVNSKPMLFERCFNFDVDLALINWRCFDVEMPVSFQRESKKILIFQASWYKNKNVFQSQPKVNVLSTLNFDAVLTLTNSYLFNINIKILIFQASWYNNKIVVTFNP